MVFLNKLIFFIKSWLGHTLKHEIARMLHLNYYDLESNFVISTTRITFSNKKEIPVRVRCQRRRDKSILKTRNCSTYLNIAFGQSLASLCKTNCIPNLITPLASCSGKVFHLTLTAPGYFLSNHAGGRGWQSAPHLTSKLQHIEG